MYKEYDPFLRGPFPVGVRTLEALDSARGRRFPCEIWYPAAARHAGHDLAPETQDVFTPPLRDTPRRQLAVRDATPGPGTYPLIVFSHASANHRRGATFLCTHLASHGYIVAALDHSEVVAPELGVQAGETAEQKAARVQALIAARVPDIRFLIKWAECAVHSFPAPVGIVGHSFGGWTALAAPDVEPRIAAVVALAPGGSTHVKPGILPLKLAFDWRRDVPSLYLIAENDVCLPLAGMYELFERTPAPKRMLVLRRADHEHFMDNVEEEHERVRTMSWPEQLAWIGRDMAPISDLCSGEQAHLFIRGLALCHVDAVLKQNEQARRFLADDIEAAQSAVSRASISIRNSPASSAPEYPLRSCSSNAERPGGPA